MKLIHLLPALLALAPSSSFAALTAISVSAGNIDPASGDTTGFRFTVGASDISVTALGFWDEGGDGLFDAHPIAIYSTDTLFVQTLTIIPAGVSAVIENGFRFVDIFPVVLEAGNTYVINAYRPVSGPGDLGNDGVLYQSPDLAVAPFITYDSNVAENDTGGVRYVNTPNNVSNGWFGANFKADAVPEPSVALLGGCAAIGLLRRRRPSGEAG